MERQLKTILKQQKEEQTITGKESQDPIVVKSKCRFIGRIQSKRQRKSHQLRAMTIIGGFQIAPIIDLNSAEAQ